MGRSTANEKLEAFAAEKKRKARREIHESEWEGEQFVEVAK